MATDPSVSAKLILDSLLHLQRQGPERAMEQLEKAEPELAGYLMEHMSLIHQKLLELGAPAKQTLRLQRRIESLLLVCIMAQRQACRPLGELPEPAEDDAPPPPESQP